MKLVDLENPKVMAILNNQLQGTGCDKQHVMDILDDLVIKDSDEEVSDDGIVRWAKKEIELAIQSEKESANNSDDWEYGVECYKSALRAFRSLCNDENSGASMSITTSILNRMIDGKPLTPVEDTPDIWNYIFDKDGVKVYQCNRVSSLFKEVDADGNITYNDINRTVAFDTLSQTTWHNGMADRLVGKIFPITMPYLPSTKRYMVNCEEFLVDPENGDYDTVGYLNIVTPDGKTVELNRYFKDDGEKMVQIDKAEYEERKAKRILSKS